MEKPKKVPEKCSLEQCDLLRGKKRLYAIDDITKL